MEEYIENFRNGIFALHTRRFGTVAEIMIKKLYNINNPASLAYDGKDKNNLKIEIKFSRVLKENDARITETNVIEQCFKALSEKRQINSTDIKQFNFDCNIQQVKNKEFDILYYGLFFKDKIEIFYISSNQILQLNNFSNKQHRGNVGEGQFHLNPNNIDYHRQNYLIKTIDYLELYNLFVKENNK